MEGKYRRALVEECRAVSEVMGQVLMIAIIVLAFSSIAITIFSDNVVVKSSHAPRVDLQGSINPDINTLYIFHMGGEAIDLKDMKVILHINEPQAEFIQTEFNMSDPGVKVWDPEGNMSTSDVLRLGDYIEINTTKKEVTLKTSGTVDVFFVHTPSQQVIQRATFQT